MHGATLYNESCGHLLVMRFISLKRHDRNRFAQTASIEVNSGGSLRGARARAAPHRCAPMHTSFSECRLLRGGTYEMDAGSEESS